MPPAPMPNPYVGSTFTFAFEGTSSYHGLDVTLSKRLSNGLTFRTNYTFSKALDLNSTASGSQSTNAPSFIAYRYNPKLSKGLAGFSVAHKFNSNFSYELPFGKGKPFGSSVTGFSDKLISGWQWNGILTIRGGFPFTPVVGRNISGTGDTRNPDVPDRTPGYAKSSTSGTTAGCGNIKAGTKLGTAEMFYDPCAFQLPIPGTL